MENSLLDRGLQKVLEGQLRRKTERSQYRQCIHEIILVGSWGSILMGDCRIDLLGNKEAGFLPANSWPLLVERLLLGALTPPLNFWPAPSSVSQHPGAEHLRFSRRLPAGVG